MAEALLGPTEPFDELKATGAGDENVGSTLSVDSATS